MSESPATRRRIAVIGGGPAGLRAAEVAANSGAEVTLFEAKRSVGRKLLVAGRGGLNLTHGEDLGRFVTRYTGPNQPPGFWKQAIGSLTPDHLRQWAESLGIETFQQRTGRVYPQEMKAAPLLRRWVERLRSLGVAFETNHRWTGITPGSPHTLTFAIHDDSRTFAADSVVLALGGASWPITGSDGNWTSILANLGIQVSALAPANCGWETSWSARLLKIAEGLPLKNLTVRAGDAEVLGELMVTSYGLEGGAIYQLGSTLRSMAEPTIQIDFKPTFSVEDLTTKLKSSKLPQAWKLNPAAHAIITDGLPDDASAEMLAAWAKSRPIKLLRPRPIDEAISSAGGVCWDELDQNLMLRKIPHVFVAGEMIDWEAPTGGYLMQGCFASGTLAGEAAARH